MESSPKIVNLEQILNFQSNFRTQTGIYCETSLPRVSKWADYPYGSRREIYDMNQAVAVAVAIVTSKPNAFNLLIILFALRSLLNWL